MKKIALLFFALCIGTLGFMTVNAASQQIKYQADYNLTKGKVISYSGLAADYDFARASLTINSVTASGNGFFSGSKLVNNSYKLMTLTSVKYQNKSCQLVNIGRVTKGTWKLTNDATGSYVGWSGDLAYLSSSVE